MELYYFTSYFEIFSAIYVAYIIADRLKKNYIAIITEHILLEHNHLKITFEEADRIIIGFETSFNSIQINQNDTTIARQHPVAINSLKALKSKTEQSKKEVEALFRDSYKTNAFSYIALYLAAYCLIIIIFSGFSQAYPNYILSNMVFLFNLFTIIYLWCAWNLDDSKGFLEKTINDNKPKRKRIVVWGQITKNSLFFINKLFDICNGYKFTIYYLCSGLIISISLPLIGFSINFQGFILSENHYELFHFVLVLFTLIFPISNFVVYFYIARARARKLHSDESLTQRIDSASNLTKSDDYKIINDFIQYCTINNSYTVSVESSENPVIKITRKSKKM